MSTKHTTWTDPEHATVEILDGEAKGLYHVSLWDTKDGYMRLGEITHEGKRVNLKTPVSEIDGFFEHLATYQAKLQAELDAERKCNRCGVHVDKTAYNQLEWFRAGGLKARVPTYYCTSCARLLHSIGAGEYTEMQERAAHVPSYEPTSKIDM